MRDTMNNDGHLDRKTPVRAGIAPEDKLLIGRKEAAAMLSISARALDYLIANNRIRGPANWCTGPHPNI